MAVPEGLAAYVLAVLATVVAPGVFGAAIVAWLGLRWQAGRRAFLAWSYLVGHFALAHVTFGWLAAGQPVPGWFLPVFALGAGALLIWWRYRAAERARTAERAERRPPDWRMAAVAVVCALVVVDAGLFANFEPVTAGDEAEIWTSKAKVLYSADGFDLGFGLLFQVRHPDYPLFNPLVQALSFASFDRLVWFENRVPIQAFSVALLLLMSVSLRRHAGALVAGALLVAFTGSSFLYMCTPAWSDLMLAFAVYAAVDGWVQWRQTQEPVHWRLACFALAAMVASKNEGAMLAVVFALALIIGRVVQRRSDPSPLAPRCLPWLLVPVSSIVLLRWFNSHWNVHNDLFDPNMGGGMGLFERVLHYLPDRAWPVIEFYGGILVDGTFGRLFVLLMLATAAVGGRRALGRPNLQILLFVTGSISAYMLIFVGTPRIFDWHLATAADRTVFHVVPVAALGCCIGLGQLQRSTAPQRELLDLA